MLRSLLPRAITFQLKFCSLMLKFQNVEQEMTEYCLINDISKGMNQYRKQNF